MSDLSGVSFQAADVAAHYVHRPPYAQDVYRAIAACAPGAGRLLDLGCGEGKIARPMALSFDEVVAVDPSAAMIALGRTLENGQAANIAWTCATAEEAALDGLFDVVTFGSSIHWMDPEAVFAKLRSHVTPGHRIAIVAGEDAYEPAWAPAWREFLEKWVPEVTGRPLGSHEWRASRARHLAHLDVIRTEVFVSEPFEQSVESFILCQHSRNTFTLSNLGARVDKFRDALRRVLTPYADAKGVLSYRVQTRLTLATLS